jgi:hypothetical protein
MSMFQGGAADTVGLSPLENPLRRGRGEDGGSRPW